MIDCGIRSFHGGDCEEAVFWDVTPCTSVGRYRSTGYKIPVVVVYVFK